MMPVGLTVTVPLVGSETNFTEAALMAPSRSVSLDRAEMTMSVPGRVMALSLTAIGAGMAGGSPGYGDSGTPDGFTTKPDNPQSIE